VKRSLIVFGVALAVVGAALWFAPLATSSSHLPVPVGSAYRFGVTGPVLFGPIAITASWTSAFAANVTVYGCGSNSACPNEVHGSVVAHGVGSHGSMGWTGKAGEYYLLVPSVDSNVTVSYLGPVAGGWVGVGLLGAGIVVLATGILLSRTPPSRPGADATD
jgi:hypothetical protein